MNPAYLNAAGGLTVWKLWWRGLIDPACHGWVDSVPQLLCDVESGTKELRVIFRVPMDGERADSRFCWSPLCMSSPQRSNDGQTCCVENWWFREHKWWM